MTADANRQTSEPAYDFLTGEGKVMEKVARVRAMLRGVPLFRDLPDKYLEELGRLAEPVERGAGEDLARQGDPGGELLMLINGTARVERNGQAIAHMGEGDFFGEFSLLDGKPRTATVVAETPVTLLVLQKHSFDHIRESAPDLDRQLLATVLERLRQLQTTLLD
ncbi:MAG: Crp/Fnr family transcriptional regulator [Chloroflexota bacterium]